MQMARDGLASTARQLKTGVQQFKNTTSQANWTHTSAADQVGGRRGLSADALLVRYEVDGLISLHLEYPLERHSRQM